MGIERLKLTLPEGELETYSDPPLDFVTKCQLTPFNLQLLRGALKDMRKDNPELQYLGGDDWRSTHKRYLRREELQDRLGAYVELSVKYAKSVIELDAAQLILDTDERHRIEYSLDNVTEILNYAFNPIPKGEDDRFQVSYDGSEIPDDNTRRNHGTGDRKTNQIPTGQNTTARANIGQNSERTHHMVNFNNREQHRTSTLMDVQQ